MNNSHQKWAHTVIYNNNEGYRFYNKFLSDEIIYINELGLFYEDLFNKGFNLYYIESEPNHEIKFNDQDLEFFTIYKNNNCISIPKNIEEIRNLQSQDLLNFYDGLYFESFMIISKITNNCYHYNLLVAANEKFNLNGFLNIKFKIIKIKNITLLNKNNLNLNFFQNIFNTDELSSYKFYEINNEEYLNDESEELKKAQNDLECWLKKQEDDYRLDISDLQSQNNQTYLNLLNTKMKIESDLQDQRASFEYFFKNFGWYLCVLNYNFSDLIHFKKNKIYTHNINSIFILETSDDGKYFWNIYDPKTNTTKLFENEIQSSCFLDLIWSLNDHFQTPQGCKYYSLGVFVISVPKIKYNTAYKQGFIFI